MKQQTTINSIKVHSQEEIDSLPDMFDSFTIIIISNDKEVKLNRRIKNAIFQPDNKATIITITRGDIPFYCDEECEINLQNDAVAYIGLCKTLRAYGNSVAFVNNATDLIYGSDRSTLITYNQINSCVKDSAIVYLNHYSKTFAYDNSNIYAFDCSKVRIFSENITIHKILNYASFQLFNNIKEIIINKIDPTVNSFQYSFPESPSNVIKDKYPKMVSEDIYIYFYTSFDKTSLKKIVFDKDISYQKLSTEVHPFPYLHNPNTYQSYPEFFLCKTSYFNLKFVPGYTVNGPIITYYYKIIGKVDLQGNILEEYEPIPPHIKETKWLI